MKKSRLFGATCACLAAVSIHANAVVVNTLNDVDYEWLELTATAGMSRLEVEAQLSDVNSELYGYEYASRSLFEDLLLSYSSWDGIDGWHGDSGVVTGMEKYLDDFGRLYTEPGDGINVSFTTVDGYSVLQDAYYQTIGFYGSGDECGVELSCLSRVYVGYDAEGHHTTVYQHYANGWSAETTPATIPKADSHPVFGSHLVMISAVPIPATAWLFGSGLLGLIGMARRKKV